MAGLPPTERLHPRSGLLDALPLRGALALLHEGDLAAARAVGRSLASLTRLAGGAARALAAGGRLVYAGAGTSGRLAAADAAECPPTFGVPPSRVVALVAGGAAALSRALEGAEDDAGAGRAAVRRARVGPRDLLVGVSASGTTPYVLAAVDEARRRGAAVALLTCNPSARPRGAARAVLATGPELVAGSTRMAAGAATKMALALVSTGAMLRLGRVRAGRMIDVAPTSAKLRRRAVRMLAELGGVEAAAARAALARSGGRVRAALTTLSARGAVAAPAPRRAAARPPRPSRPRPRKT